MAVRAASEFAMQFEFHVVKRWIFILAVFIFSMIFPRVLWPLDFLISSSGFPKGISEGHVQVFHK